MSAMTITLPPALDRIVRDKVNAGLYASETELVCVALRREFARDAVHEWVRTQAAEGLRSSMPVSPRNSRVRNSWDGFSKGSRHPASSLCASQKPLAR